MLPELALRRPLDLGSIQDLGSKYSVVPYACMRYKNSNLCKTSHFQAPYQTGCYPYFESFSDGNLTVQLRREDYANYPH